MEKIIFKEVNKNSESDIRMLYEILKLRKFNISHDKLPEFDEHNKFVLGNLYRVWKFIDNGSQTIGTFYITCENVVSVSLIVPNKTMYISVISKILERYKPLKEKKSIRSKYFIFNSNPNNKEYIQALESLKIVHIQNTYAFKNMNL